MSRDLIMTFMKTSPVTKDHRCLTYLTSDSSLLSVTQSATTTAMFTCISCRIAFDTAEEQRSHFGTDWHRYNMKRRVANLPPVSAAAFNEKVIERREQNAVRPDPRDMACAACK